MRLRAGRWAIPLLVVALAAAAGLGLGRALGPAPATTPQLATEQRLMCPQCEETRLDVCDRPICLDMKADIGRRLLAGESPDAIVAAYGRVYGSRILAGTGPADPYVFLPWLAVVLALGGLAAFGAAGRRPIPALPPLAARPRGRVDEELAAWRSGR
ncbi:MAG: hypothetical protein NVS9B1_20680 [Candidatus Dormibacteraceae bacterium]